MPPLHFSNFISQRGTMHICAAGCMPGMAIGCADPGIAPMPIELIIDRSIIITLDIRFTPLLCRRAGRRVVPREVESPPDSALA